MSLRIDVVAAIALLASAVAAPARAQPPRDELGDPARSGAIARAQPAPLLPLAPATNEKSPPETPPPSFLDLLGSAWAASMAGFGIGAAVGALVGLVAGLACGPSDPWAIIPCPALAPMMGIGPGAMLGVVSGAGIGVWRAGDVYDAGGEGWWAMLGAVLLPAVVTGLVGLVALAVDEQHAGGITGAVGGVSAFVLPQLGATIAYELSR
ncbi:MAG: hypothetical protein M5U28_18925 [Sandaracinaceae bacterium]|nr:hypothetical protein [Sandaracinaceae bacterium]